jgi:hypothetical protein
MCDKYDLECKGELSCKGCYYNIKKEVKEIKEYKFCNNGFKIKKIRKMGRT